MNAKPIIMTVGFQARPGKEAELREALTEVLMPTRREDGCLFYDLHVAADDPSKFLFHESWASNAHHDAHDHHHRHDRRALHIVGGVGDRSQ